MAQSKKTKEVIDMVTALTLFNKLTQDLTVAAINKAKIVKVALLIPSRSQLIFKNVTEKLSPLLSCGLVQDKMGDNISFSGEIQLEPHISLIWNDLNICFAEHYKKFKRKLVSIKEGYKNYVFPASPWFSAYDFSSRLSMPWNSLLILTKADHLAEFLEDVRELLSPERDRVVSGVNKDFLEQLEKLTRENKKTKKVLESQKDLLYIADHMSSVKSKPLKIAAPNTKAVAIHRELIKLLNWYLSQLPAGPHQLSEAKDAIIKDFPILEKIIPAVKTKRLPADDSDIANQ